MKNYPSKEKAILRKKLKTLRAKNLSKSVELDIFYQAKKLIDKVKPLSIHCYLSMKDEVNTEEIIKYTLSQNILTTCPGGSINELSPVILSSLNDLSTSSKGFKFPKDKIKYEGKIDIFFIPALGFDKKLNRLGYGAGFYDRLLLKYPDSLKVGLAYESQILECLPVDKHDQKMNLIFTGEKTYGKVSC